MTTQPQPSSRLAVIGVYAVAGVALAVAAYCAIQAAVLVIGAGS